MNIAVDNKIFMRDVIFFENLLLSVDLKFCFLHVIFNSRGGVATRLKVEAPGFEQW